jgi:hypothetical protein
MHPLSDQTAFADAMGSYERMCDLFREYHPQSTLEDEIHEAELAWITLNPGVVALDGHGRSFGIRKSCSYRPFEALYEVRQHLHEDTKVRTPGLMLRTGGDGAFKVALQIKLFVMEKLRKRLIADGCRHALVMDAQFAADLGL